MAVTETTNESWISRLGGSIKGVAVGIGLFILAFPLLFRNEGNCVKTAKALDEGEGACISVETNETIDPEMDGCLVYMTGRADTQDVLSDDTFGISTVAIRLVRKLSLIHISEPTRPY